MLMDLLVVSSYFAPKKLVAMNFLIHGFWYIGYSVFLGCIPRGGFVGICVHWASLDKIYMFYKTFTN